MFGFDNEPYKKHSSEECLAFLLTEIQADPNMIRMKVNSTTDAEYKLFNTVLWPAVLDVNAWTRIATKRPGPDNRRHDDESVEDKPIDHEQQYKTIRYYENDVWLDNSRDLRAVITELYGELSLEIICNW